MVERVTYSSSPLLMCLFLAACPADTLDEGSYSDARVELDCQARLACGEVSEESECPTGFGGSGACARYDAEAAQRCIDALEQLLDEVEADAGACPDPFQVAACDEVFVPTGGPECGPSVGRPLTIDGRPRLVPVRRWVPSEGVDETRLRAAKRWLECARGEAASVPAFERLHDELLRNGAPKPLLAQCRDARRDEVEHAHLCAAIVGELSGAKPELGALPPVSARPGAGLEQLAVEALLEGAIGEGSAAAWAAAAVPGADPPCARVLRRIATDELRHATLSWRILAWALDQRPELGPALRGTLDRWQPRGTAELRLGLARFGVLGVGQEQVISQTLVETVVRPTLDALCARYCAAPTISVPSAGC